jgi:predicted DNA-binding protein YlxM (UPF0122 family)
MSPVTLMEGSDPRIDLYESGYSLSEVAAATNYSKSGVYYWLKANHIELRSPGYSREINNTDESNEQEAS